MVLSNLIQCVLFFLVTGLTQLGIESPQVFLVSTFELHLCDFYLLHETLERDLCELKKYALLSAMPNIDLEIISKKKEAFKHRIPLFAALCAAVPVPGLSIAVDLAVMADAVKDYVLGFGLDIPSLKRLSSSTGVPYNDLCAVINSPLAAVEITSELLLKVIMVQCSDIGPLSPLTTAEEIFSWIPIFGIPVAMGISFTRVYKCLNVILSQLTEDARRVFRRALGINTSV